MTEIKQIDPAALAGITTGILLTDWSDLHEAAEWIIGHPIWTHQFLALSGKLSEAVLAQFPGMPTKVEHTWETCRDHVRTKYGATVAVRQGGESPISPLAHIPERLLEVGAITVIEV